MLKALIIGADGVCPDYIFDYPELYPNLTKLTGCGAHAAYSAYVQKGYKDSYWSEMNWSSIYTGLAPWEHGIGVKGADGRRRAPFMTQFHGLKPFWQLANENGLTMGLWAAFCCEDPVEIDGYVVSVRCKALETPAPVRTSVRTLQVCEKDRCVLDLVLREVPPRLYPCTLEQQGYAFTQLKEDPDLAWQAIEAYHFQDALENFEQELEFFYASMCRVQEQYPVDVLYFFTPTTDLIAHHSMYCDNSDVLVRAYQLLDRYVGKWMETLQPENIIVLSDHGMVNFKDLVRCPDEAVRREAFAARDEVIWLPNGHIAFEGHNGALLFTAHGLKGLFIASGKDIGHTELQGMRTLDIYPAVLELLGIKVPDGRVGYVPDMFSRPLVNGGRTLDQVGQARTKAAILQCFSPSLTDILLNELYVRNRFVDFTVVGEEKYREIFLHNPRVSGFVPYRDFHCGQFDAVYCGIHHETTGLTGHIRVR